MVENVPPQRLDAVALERRAGDDRRRPVRRPRRQDVQRRAILGRGKLGAGDIVAVGLVDRDHVGELDDAFLERLQLVAGAGQRQHQEKIGHVGDRNFRLADADGLDQDHVVARGLAKQHGLARLRRDAAERAGRRRGADEGVGVVGELRHARLVGEDRAAGAPRRRIDRQHRDLAALPGEHAAQRVDHGRLADARGAGDADAHRFAGVAQQRLGQRGGGAAVVGALALDQRDGARQHGAVAAADIAREPFDIRGRGGRGHAVSSARAQCVKLMVCHKHGETAARMRLAAVARPNARAVSYTAAQILTANVLVSQFSKLQPRRREENCADAGIAAF